MWRRVSRRTFIATSGAATLAAALPAAPKKIPVGLELYSVREALAKDLMGTVRAVAKMGYECVEYYAPYFKWTPSYAKEVRAMMDDAGIRCSSTHNDEPSFTPEGLKKAAELNHILGSEYVVWAFADPVTIDAWKGVAAGLSNAAEKLAPLNLKTGYHNHGLEFRLLNGQRPIDILSANTPASVMLQLDVGHCVEGGGDPVAFIHANPGRVKSLHCKDWKGGKGSRLERTETPTGGSVNFGNGNSSGETGFRVLIGEGDIPWKRVIDAAESVGGVEFYLIEQEGSRFPELETAERSLLNWKKVKAQF